MSQQSFPTPVIDRWNKPFWDACRQRRLIAQRCLVSRTVWLPPAPVSPITRTDEWEWTQLSGFGQIISWVRMHKTYFALFPHAPPYNVIQVALDEGPIIISNLTDPHNDDIAVGTRVSVEFEDVSDTLTLHRFSQVSS